MSRNDMYFAVLVSSFIAALMIFDPMYVAFGLIMLILISLL